MDEKLLNLPWEVQLALASGYAAYMLAYVGIREHHKAIDVTFRTLAFGLCATAVLALSPSQLGWPRAVAAVLVALMGGVLWRFWLAEGMQRAIRNVNLSWSDDTPSAWSRVTQHNSRHFVTQVTVHLDDDSWLFCDATGSFGAAPFGPCIFGTNGDIALYVTHSAAPGEDFKAVGNAVRDTHHGDELTWVPASRIRKVSVRLKGSVNASSAEAGQAQAQAQAVEAVPSASPSAVPNPAE
ncbi:MAG TPA: hypothetical protein VF547_08290 [Allosphingosinicella sp.]|jgi:hypothetical protein